MFVLKVNQTANATQAPPPLVKPDRTTVDVRHSLPRPGFTIQHPRAPCRTGLHRNRLEGLLPTDAVATEPFFMEIAPKAAIAAAAPARWGAQERILCFYWPHAGFFHARATASSFTRQDETVLIV